MGKTFIVVVSLSTAALLLTASKLLSKRRRLPYPPGPKPKFLIGNALDMPSMEPGRVYKEWGEKYDSNIVHASVLGQHVFVVNDLATAEELFEKRANIYSDRLKLPIVEIMGWEYNIAGMSYGENWRQHRRMCQQNFHNVAAKSYQPIQLEKVRSMLRGLLESPDRLDDHSKMHVHTISWLSVSIALSMMYGYDVKTLDDPVIQVGEESLKLGINLIIPGQSLINIFPFLRHIPTWMPGAREQRTVAEVRRLTEEMKRIPKEFVTKALMEGTAKPSLVTNFLESKCDNRASDAVEAIVDNVAVTVYGAAVDTTISATDNFLYLIAKHPEVQRRAQDEIDNVIGNDRLPDFSDRPSLPYIEAIYREVMRYNPPLHLGVAHMAMEDDVYQGYLIPKGSVLFGNIWGMTHDERVYPEPSAFKPERFLDAEGRLNDDSRVLAYGFGRRICVGKHIASANMWLTIVSVLACFDVGKAKDELGNEVEINDEYDHNVVLSHKKPFKCSFTPRSDQIRRLIENSAE